MFNPEKFFYFLRNQKRGEKKDSAYDLQNIRTRVQDLDVLRFSMMISPLQKLSILLHDGRIETSSIPRKIYEACTETVNQMEANLSLDTKIVTASNNMFPKVEYRTKLISDENDAFTQIVTKDIEDQNAASDNPPTRTFITFMRSTPLEKDTIISQFAFDLKFKRDTDPISFIEKIPNTENGYTRTTYVHQFIKGT
jgi:hypothetical protein